MEPKKILILCDESDISIIESSFEGDPGYSITIETTEKILNIGVEQYLEETIQLIQKNPSMFDGVVGTHDSSAVFAAVICGETGKHFASMESIINCQNKYISRTIQKKCVPGSTPEFCLDVDYLQGKQKISPVFVKPVRSNVSFSSQQIYSPDELLELIALNSQKIADYNQYFVDSLAVSSADPNQVNLDTCNRFICEGLISGEQVTVDGFVFENDVTVFGITKAIFFEDGISFSHHEFPYDIPEEMEVKLREMITVLVNSLGLNNTFFNVELKIDTEKGDFFIIEVNSRIAFQFAKTIKAVMGVDPLHWLCDIATGQKPVLNDNFKKEYKYCYNFELREFSDKEVIKTPIQANLEEIYLMYPEVEIRNLIRENTRLSDYKHNPESYRYCMLDIPGNSRDEIMIKFWDVKYRLGYQFEDIE